MIITKEQQEAWISNYVKEKHTQDECIGFIDGVEKAMSVVNNNLVKPDSGQLLSFFLWFRTNGELHIDKSIEAMIEIYLKESNLR